MVQEIQRIINSAREVRQAQSTIVDYIWSDYN